LNLIAFLKEWCHDTIMGNNPKLLLETSHLPVLKKHPLLNSLNA
jgi:hypothetical protein